MILVTGSFRIPVDRIGEVRGAMERVIAASRAEPGCIDYSYAEDVLEPGLFRVSEAWESREALSAHFETEHMRNWQHERAEFGFHDRQVTAQTASQGEDL